MHLYKCCGYYPDDGL
jgi:cytochrome P450